ncbi:MAG: MFS transporter [Steroidobacteraceae bacterium]
MSSGEGLSGGTSHRGSSHREIAARVHLRLALPCILFMLMSSLDRANISFAASAMNAELGFTPTQYGFGAGILFAGFLAGQYPSLFLLQRVGFRAWICICALLWGFSAAALGFIHTHAQFYVLRVLIGVAEGGLAPGIVLYLSQFATERERATTFTLPALAIPASVIIGAPLSGWLLELQHGLSMSGWRFMLLAEAVPTILFGLFAPFYFPDTPREARFLDEDQRNWLATHAAQRADRPRHNDWSVLGTPIVVLAGLLWFCLLCGSYGVIFWLPQVIHALTGFTPLIIGLIGALPWIGVAFGMYFNARHSDRTGERYWHVALPAVVAAMALLVAWQAGPGAAAMVLLLVAGLGLGSAQGGFWAIPTQLLKPAEFSVAVVAINILGSAGGLVMPQLMGIARERSGGFAAPTLLVVGVLLLAVLLVAAIRVLYRREIAALPSARAD